MKYYLEVLKKYAVFSGRASRAEFWWFTLVNCVIYFAIMILQMALREAGNGVMLVISVVSLIYLLAIIIPNLAVAVRRLHDSNLSGWWLFIGLVPFVGGIVLLVFYVLASTPGANRFGPQS